MLYLSHVLLSDRCGISQVQRVSNRVCYPGWTDLSILHCLCKSYFIFHVTPQFCLLYRYLKNHMFLGVFGRDGEEKNQAAGSSSLLNVKYLLCFLYRIFDVCLHRGSD